MKSLLFLIGLISPVVLFGQGPGGVGSNLQLWLRADLGVEEAAMDDAEVGDDVLNWLDQSGNGNDFTNDFGGAPEYVNTNGRFALDFSGGSDYLRASSIISGTGARTMILFVQPTSLSSSASNCAFGLAPNESTGMGYSLFLEEPGTTGLACRVSGNRIMNYAADVTKPTLFSVQNGASENVGQTIFYANGTEVTDEISAVASTLNTSALGCIIGGFSSGADNDPETSFDFNGDISEIIVYDKALTGTERQAIETYFNIRYGVTIPVASHDFFSYSSYGNDIAGIGQDAAFQAFTQDSAYSINSSSVLTVYNPSALSDGDYLVWGHDNGNASSFVEDVLPSSASFRTERIWRAEETNDVGTVTLRFYLPGISSCGAALNASDIKLLIDGSDTDFSDATVIDAQSYSNDSLYFTGVNLDDGDHFTIALSNLERPADIDEGLVLWLKADCGVEEATSDAAELGDGVVNWLDQSFSNADVTNSVGAAPVYGTINGDTMIDFSGGSAYLTGSSVFSGDGARTMIIVAQPTSLSSSSANNCPFTLAPNDTPGTGYSLFVEEPNSSNTTGLAVRVSGNRIMDYTTSTVNPTIFQVSGDSDINVSATNVYANGQFLTQEVVLNDISLNTNGIGTIVGGFSSSGNLTPNSSFDFNGYVFEIIVFSREVSCTERKQLEVYLEVKYGIELDYFDETSTGSNGLEQEVDGILKRYGSYADSTSASSGGLQLADASFLTDAGDALYVGNNGASGVNTSDVPGVLEARISRAWFADYTSCNNNAGNVTLSFDQSGLVCGATLTPQNASNYRLLTSATSDFSSATVISGATLNGSSVEFTVDVSSLSDRFFTVGSIDSDASPLWYDLGGPGGISSGLQLWLMSDCGIEEAAGDDAEEGDGVLNWLDQSGNGNNVSNDFGGAPTYTITSGNPGVDFSSGSDYLRGSAVISGNTARTLFVVLNANSLAAGNGNSALSLAPNNTSGTGYSLSLESPGGTNGLALRVSGNKVMDYTVPTGSPVLISTQSGTGENVTDTEFFVDGESVIDVQSSGSATLNTNTLGVIIGGWSTDGDHVPETTWDFDGTIHEVIVFNRELSCAEREEVEAYLANKFSIDLYYARSEDIGDNGISTDIGFIEEGSASATSSAVTLDDVGFLTDCVDTVWIAHDNGSGTVFKADDPDMSGLAGDSVQRWGRIWHAIVSSNETDAGTVRLIFDLDDYPGTSGTTVSGSDYRLITSASPWAYATTLSGPTIDAVENTVSFTVSVDEINQRDFTLATGNSSASPLPVELLRFDARAAGQRVELTWETASEKNNDYFLVERSGSGWNWSELQRVEGVGNSSEQVSYRTHDDDPLSGRSYYRLRQVDEDGSFSFSPVRAVELSAFGFSAIQVFPNPTRDILHVYGDQETLSNLLLFNLQGLNVSDKISFRSISDQQLDVDVGQLPSGIYMLVSPYQSIRVIKE